jgi:hypothetical protein
MELRLSGQQQELLRQLLPQCYPQQLTPEQSAHLESIRAAHLAELESYTPGPDLKVRTTSLPNGGTEFYFPAAPFDTNAPGLSLLLLIMFCILYGVSGPLFSNFHPGVLVVMPLYAIWAFLTLLLLLWVLRLWLAPDRVTIANGVLSTASGIFRRTKSMPVSEIATIHAVPGSRKMHSAIRISGRRFFKVGDGIRDSRDAEWLAMQISRAAGIKPSASLPIDYADEQLEQVQTFLKTFEGAQSSGNFR